MKRGPSKTLLLDVNVLLALAWPNHQFHGAVLRRLERSPERWATCAVTQLGFIRLSANPGVVGVSKSPAEAAALLSRLVADPLHVYLEASPAPVAPAVISAFGRILGYKQVTDAYLLRLARQHDAALVTFDRRLQAMAEGEGTVELLRG